ncbi:MAG: phytoene desaturase [Pseudobdellovibrio sp.]
MKKQLKAVVVGSGFGGLATAIRLQVAGVQTTLIEKNSVLGGKATYFERDGFRFDCGPTVITAPQALEELFLIAGKKIDDYVKLLPVSPFYRLFWSRDKFFDYFQESEKIKNEISKFSVEDLQGYDNFLKYSQEVFNEGYTKLAATSFTSFWSMARVAPKLIKLSAYRSVFSVVSRFIKNEYLRQAFSFHALLIGGNPFSSSSIYTLIHFIERNWGVYFPKGGTSELVKAFSKLFVDLGGTIITDCSVTQINTENKKVVSVSTSQNKTYSADIIVSNADITYTYNELLKTEPLTKSTAQQLLKADHSMSLFVIYFGAKNKYSNIPHHTVLFGERYKGLLDDVFNKKILADDFSLYLHHPSVTDPSLAPADCSSFYVLSPVPNLASESIQWSQELTEAYAQKILGYLDKNYLPDLKQNILFHESFTPLDFKNKQNAHLGSAFSLEPLLTQSAYFRGQNKDKKIAGLYFAGAGTHPGAGVPGVVNSAKATCALIAEDFNLRLPEVGTSPTQFKGLLSE